MRSTRKSEPQPFLFNLALLCYYSTYFKTLLSGPFKESQERKTEFLVDASQQSLRLFYGWLATGRIFMEFHAEVICELFVFADFIGCLALQRAILTCLPQISKGLHGGIYIIDYQTLSDCKIVDEHRISAFYRYILGTYVFHWEHEMDDDLEDPTLLHPAFLHDRLKSMSKHRQMIGRGVGVGDCPCCSNVCKYHSHPNDEERSATCGSKAEDLALKFWEKDADDVYDQDEQINGVQDITHEEQALDVEMEGGITGASNQDTESKEVEIQAGEEKSDSNLDQQMDLAGSKRKALDEDEDGSAKKLKQESEIRVEGRHSLFSHFGRSSNSPRSKRDGISRQHTLYHVGS